MKRVLVQCLRGSVAVGLCVLTIGLSAPAALAAGSDPIGLFTAVQGQVSVEHASTAAELPVNLHDDVFFRDIIATKPASKSKALFEDDSLLTVGPESRVEVNEYIYDPNRDLRSTVISLGTGTLRALVGKVFEGAGSRFEIHTANATAAARGTHFVVWVEETASGAGRPAALAEAELVAVPVGASGIANIGQTGDVAFTAEGVTVIVKPGMYSVAAPGEPPIQPATIAAKAPQALIQAVTQTQLQDMALPESPTHVLALLGDNVLSDPLATTTGLLAGATGTLGDVTETLGNTAESVLDTANSLTTDVTSTLTSTVTTTTTAVPGIIGIFTNDTVTALSAGGGGGGGGVLPGGTIVPGTLETLLPGLGL